MTLGDGFATPFTTGSYIELKIFGWSGLNGTGTQVGNEIDFYLANYTSASSLPLDVWTLVNLSSLAGAQSLTFDYASSDVGEFGINTPEYFAMDDLTLNTSVPEPSSAVLALTGLGIMGLTVAHRRSCCGPLIQSHRHRTTALLLALWRGAREHIAFASVQFWLIQAARPRISRLALLTHDQINRREMLVVALCVARFEAN